MAAEELKKEEQAQPVELREREKVENPAALLQQSLDGLNKFGGFQMVKGLIKGVENMDPRRKAVKNIFLSDTAYKDSRKKLKNELELWVNILEAGGTDPMQIIEQCTAKRDKAETNLKNNLFHKNQHKQLYSFQNKHYHKLDSKVQYKQHYKHLQLHSFYFYF